MIKIEHVVLPSPEQMEFIIEGMRNPMNSWDKSDSETWVDAFINGGYSMPTATTMDKNIPMFKLGNNDLALMQKLSVAGTDHRKFMRKMIVMMRITAPLYWWKEFDTYKVGTVSNSCSTMHKIHAKEFTPDDFSHEHLFNGFYKNENHTFMKSIIDRLEANRKIYLALEGDEKKIAWWQMIQLLPSSYNQTRNVMVDYEVLKNIYTWRKNHKLDEWRDFCKWIESLPYSDLITESKTREEQIIDKVIDEFVKKCKELKYTFDNPGCFSMQVVNIEDIEQIAKKLKENK